MRRRPRLSLPVSALLFAGLTVPAAGAAAAPTAAAATGESATYLIVLKNGVSGAAAERLVTAAGGSVVADLTEQIGVVTATSAVPGFDSALRASNMQQIRTEEAHAIEAGSPMVDVGILDSGIDGRHADFVDAEGVRNVDCERGADFVAVGPGVGTPDPCTDNQYHGTHVAGTVGARANGVGIVGVAPNVTLVPVKVCDTSGYCYASSVVEGITYSGDQKFDVINMSFYVDDDQFQQSTEFKCMSDPVQRTFRRAVERAVQYARSQGVTPIAALGNSDQDLAHPVDEDGEPIANECEVVPAETQGVIGVASVGPGQEKATYSNYGVGRTDVTAPGGNSQSAYPAFPGPCGTQILSTIPFGSGYACIQGTSMAAPHAAGVAALIVSEFGTVGRDGDVTMPPQEVEAYLQSTTADIGLPGYDMCFGNGRIDALRAVTHDTSRLRAQTPPCPEYSE